MQRFRYTIPVIFFYSLVLPFNNFLGVLQSIFNRGTPRRYIPVFYRYYGAIHNLNHCGVMRRNNRAAASHGFCLRHSEPLVQCRRDVAFRKRVQFAQVRIGNERGKNNRVFRKAVFVYDGRNVRCSPLPCSDDYQLRIMIFMKLLEDLQKELQILSWLKTTNKDFFTTEYVHPIITGIIIPTSK